MSDDDEVKVSPTPLCPARWGAIKGYIAVRDPFTGEVHEIPYPKATPVWKSDIRRQMQDRRG